MELQYPTKPGSKLKKETAYLFLTFALRKFSGGMGDEDDNESQNMWQNYFIKPIDVADKVVVTQKANGEAAHISCRRIGDQNFFCLGSKNVHLLARNIDDVSKYSDGRFMIANVVAKAFFITYMEPCKSKLGFEEKREDFITFLNTSKYTGVFEILQPTYQHIENLSYLDSPELRFICWTKMYSENDCDSLCSMPPNIAIDTAKSFGVDTIDYEIIKASEAEDYMLKIRSEKDYEGKVLYFLDADENVFGIIKKKTAWYIILRSIREKSSTFTSPKNNNSRVEMDKKVTKRIAQIQVWLGFSDEYRRQWTELGTGFVHWIVTLVRREPARSVSTRSQFPILWKEYLASNPAHETLYKNIQYSQEINAN